MRRTLLLIAGFWATLYISTLGAAQAFSSSRFHLNYTDSVPVGLYRETSSRSGLYAGFCLPAKTLRHYSAADFATVAGDCPGHFAPLLKPLLRATAAQPITFSEQGFSIAGRPIVNTAPRLRTHSGAPLVHYPFGTYVDGLWAISNHNPGSYDSRYFGPVAEAQIRFYVVPFLTL